MFNAPKPGSSLICWHCCVCTSTMRRCIVPSSNVWTINNLHVCWGGDSYRLHVCWGGDSYRLAKIHSHFDAVFGSDWTQVCVVGFEANPKHAARLTELARCYLSLGYKVQPQQQPLPLVMASALQPHTHTLTITCACCYDVINEKVKTTRYSHAASLILLSCFARH